MSWVTDAKETFSESSVMPCPVCGAEPKPCGDRTCGYETYWVFCPECGYEVDCNVPSMRTAIREWNRSAKRKGADA